MNADSTDGKPNSHCHSIETSQLNGDTANWTNVKQNVRGESMAQTPGIAGMSPDARGNMATDTKG